MIDVFELRKSYGGQTVFGGASFRLSAGEHLALVGPNGSGKTTLLRMLMGQESPDGGEIRKPRRLSLGYLPQDLEVGTGEALITFVEDVASEVRALEAECRELGDRLAEGESDPELLERYGLCQARFEHLGGYRLRAQAGEILTGLGFATDSFRRPLSSFSGGWRMRAALARILLSEPDLILLDEPTNHLDIVSLEWLEAFLSTCRSAFVVVSHDVAFLDRIARGVLALETGKVLRSKGNYSDYVQEKSLREAQVRAAQENAERRRAQVEGFAERFRYKATKARQVQSRLRQLERKEDPPSEAPPPVRAFRLQLPQPERSGRTVAILEGVSAGYGERPVYTGLDFRIERGEKVVLIGPNGAGKSTLLKLLAGEIAPSGGRLAHGHNVTVSYFAQHQLEQLDPRRTVLEEMMSLPGLRSELELRRVLGAFLFSGDSVEKRVEILSGGEKSRLVLAKMLTQPGNFLLMDEPTNHLDIQGCSVLKDALSEYEGTVCLITHDRDLINRLATRVVYVDGGALGEYIGNYDDFAAKRVAEEAAAASAPERGRVAAPDGERGTRRDERRADAERRNRIRRQTAPLRARVEGLEAEIAEAEARLAEVDARIADPATYADPRAGADLGREQISLRRALEELTGKWERAALELEDAERRAMDNGQSRSQPSVASAGLPLSGGRGQ